MIYPFDATKEHLTSERCYIVELLNSADDPSCSIARARVVPGVVTQKHALDGIIERYMILSGTGRVEIDDMPPFEVGPSTVVHIPAGAPQRIANTGSVDLIFFCICTPRFTPASYRNLE